MLLTAKSDELTAYMNAVNNIFREHDIKFNALVATILADTNMDSTRALMYLKLLNDNFNELVNQIISLTR